MKTTLKDQRNKRLLWKGPLDAGSHRFVARSSGSGRRFLASRIALLVCILAAASVSAEGEKRIEVRLKSGIVDHPVSGRLLVYLSQNPKRPPIQSLDWFHPNPLYAIDVSDFSDDQRRIIDDHADGFPDVLSSLADGKYYVQAILDRDIYYPVPADGPGNIFSPVVEWTLSKEEPKTSVTLVLSQRVQPQKWVDTEYVKFIEQRSQRLSRFFDCDFFDRAAVILPPSYYAETQRRYPVYYEVSGFGGTLRGASQRAIRPPKRESDEQPEMIHVLLTGECKWGHHVYANSAINGPRGDVLVDELIPAIDAGFRTVADSRARFVGGHSSGGWSSLWLQINYPEMFGGVWSSSPDPVDFRDWQGTDLYASPALSVFVDPQGNKRPLARRGTEPSLWYRNFCKMDDVLGRGGQLRSFEAVFSPIDQDGKPKKCWDRANGDVDPAVVAHWKQYDISLILKERWPILKDHLAGKIHVVMGELDTFYLEGATILLAERLKELGSDARVEIIPKASHGLPPHIQARKYPEMQQAFLRHFKADGSLRSPP